VANLLVGADGVSRLRLATFGQHGGLVARKAGALVELAVNLPLELAYGPATAQGFGVIKSEGFPGTATTDELDVIDHGSGNARARSVRESEPSDFPVNAGASESSDSADTVCRIAPPLDLADSVCRICSGGKVW
jgi:hypothetical protein